MINKPKPSKKDVAYSLAKAALGSIPYAGATASELLSLLVAPPLERRRNEWIKDLGERLTTLEENGIVDLNALQNNDLFLDTVLYATQIALRTSEKEKIEYLRNAVLNTAQGETPEESLAKMFLTLIDQYTLWHIKILSLFDDPEGWFKSHSKTPPNLMMGGLSTLLTEAYPELKGQMNFCNLIWDDLHRAGLHNSGSLQAMMSGQGLLASRTTEFGKQFLSFIKEQQR